MPFSRIQGQDRAVGPLRAALARGALHHAYLFSGPPGVGKALAAKALAQAANCENPAVQPGGLQPPGMTDACGKCGPCRKIEKRIHPDVIELAEERTMAKAGRWEPKGGRAPSKDIVVDQVRDVVDRRLALKRYEGRRRFVIVDPADAMNVAAQNAFLKTLEEPPEDTTLVLVASNADALLPTIRSRCARVAFAPLPAELVEAKLREEGRAPEEARLAAALAAGSLGRALALDAKALAERRKAIEDAAALDGGTGLRPATGGARGPGAYECDDASRWIAFAREHGEDREAAAEACELLLVWLRDVLAAQTGPAAPLALGELAPLTRDAAAKLTPAQVLHRGERVKQALAALRHNASAALALERMLIGWFHG